MPGKPWKDGGYSDGRVWQHESSAGSQRGATDEDSGNREEYGRNHPDGGAAPEGLGESFPVRSNADWQREGG